MSAITADELEKLSVAERLELLELVWDSLSDMPEAIPLTEAQRDEIDRRLQHLAQNPESVESAEHVKAYIRDPKRSR